VLYIVRGGKIALISPVSTAGLAGYHTPEGRFAIYRKVVGYDPSPLGVLLNPMYFVAGYAIHGNPSVPPYPASHGCIRVPNFVNLPAVRVRAVRRERLRLLVGSAAPPSPPSRPCAT